MPSGELALHVLETMLGIMETPKRGAYREIATTCSVPEPLPENFPCSESPTGLEALTDGY